MAVYQAIRNLMGDAMAKTYTCRDVGVDCDWKTSGATEDEVMALISEHAA